MQGPYIKRTEPENSSIFSGKTKNTYIPLNTIEKALKNYTKFMSSVIKFTLKFQDVISQFSK